MKKRIKLKKWVVPALIIILLLIPTSYSFYSSYYESSLVSKFLFTRQNTDAYVRATVITYWVDTNNCLDKNDFTTCSISGKSSWKLKNNVTNSNWILLEDGYYYYKLNVNSSEITNENIQDSEIVLIDKNLSFSNLSDELLAGTEVIPQYEIIYEFVESDSVKTAWNVSYDTNFPVLIK